MVCCTVHAPPRHPKLKYMNQMFGAQMLMMKPNDAINVPAITTGRHPYLFVRAPAIGPAHAYTFNPCILCSPCTSVFASLKISVWSLAEPFYDFS